MSCIFLDAVDGVVLKKFKKKKERTGLLCPGLLMKSVGINLAV